MLSSQETYQTLRSRLDGLAGAHPYAALVHGSPGLGRSWLAGRAAGYARSQGHRVISASAQLFPAAAGRPLLAHLLDQACALGEPDGRRGNHADRADRGDLAAELNRSAADGPLLLVVDDVHAADPQAQQALFELPMRVQHPYLSTLLTASGSAIQSGERTWHHNLIELRPLGDSYATVLATTLLDDQASSEQVQRVIRQSGGNPMLLAALVRDVHAASDSTLRQSRYDQEFSHAVLQCLSRMPEVSELAAAIAILGEAPRAVINQVSGQSRTLTGLHALVSAGLLDPELRFRHPITAELVLDSVEPARRIELHDRAAASLSELGEPTMRIAGHLVQGSDDGPDWALDVLLDAAEICLAEDRPDEQVAFLRKASTYQVVEEQRGFDILATLARAEWRLNPTAADRHVRTLRDRLDPDRSSPQHTSSVIRQLYWHGNFTEAAELLRRLAARQDTDRARAIELHFIRHWLRFTLPIQADRVADAFQQALPDGDARLQTNLSSRVRCANLIAMLIAGEDDPDVVGREVAILAAEPTDGSDFEMRSAAAAALICHGYHEVAKDWCQQMIAEWTYRRAGGWRTPFVSHLAAIRLIEGDLRAAYELATESLQAMSPRAWGIGIGQPLATAIVAAAGLGLHTEAAQLVARPVPDAMLVSRYGLFYIRARGRHYLAAGLGMPALADFQACGAMMARWQRDQPRLLSWRLDAAQALHACDRDQEARRLVREQLAMLGPDPSPLRANTLQALADLTTGPERKALLAEVVEVLRTCGDPAELGRAALAVGHQDQAGQLALARRSASRTSRSRGRSLSRPAGTVPPAAPVPAPAGEQSQLLSDAELRVALLAAGGDSNREIAEQLFITVSTVEQHLTRVYRKLGVRRRDGLAAVLELSSTPPA